MKNEELYSLDGIIMNTLNEIDGNRKRGIQTGFEDLDEVLWELEEGFLYLVAARPCIGKTSFVLSIAEHIVLNEGLPVLYFSTEMSQKQSEKYLRKEMMNNALFFVDDRCFLTSSEVISKCREMKERENIGVVIVDYLQLIAPLSGMNYKQRITEAAGELKELAEELKLSIIVVSQLGHSVDLNPDNKPLRKDLRYIGDGEIEKYTDVEMLLYREDYYNPYADHEKGWEVNIVKNINGQTRVVNCKRKKTMVSFRELIDSYAFQNAESKLSFVVGKGTDGQTVIGDIAKMPHILVAGSAGSGKTVCIKSIIMSILHKATPEDVRMIIIDPKMVEYTAYNGIPHMLRPVVTDPKEGIDALYWTMQEMEKRYRLFARHNVRDLEGFNKKAEESTEDPERSENEDLLVLPHIIVVVDELADLMVVSREEAETAIVRLAQLCRAVGIHMIIATQVLSENVLTGPIKANILSKVAFSVSNDMDSRTILGVTGAENLQGMGDMLYWPAGCYKPMRVQGTFVSEEDVKSVTDFIRKRYGNPESFSEIPKNVEKIRSIVIVDDVRKFPSNEMLIVAEPGAFDDYDDCFEDDSLDLDFNFDFPKYDVDVDKLLKVIKSCNTVIGPTIRSDHSENNYAAMSGLPMQPDDYLAILHDLKPDDFKGAFKSANKKRPGDVLYEFIHNPNGYKLKICDIPINDDIDIHIALIPNDYGRYDVAIVSFHDVPDGGEQV